MSHMAKVAPLALLTRQPRKAIKAPVTLRACVPWEAPSSICSRAAHLALSARGPRGALQASRTLWPHFSHLSFHTRISRETHGAWTPGEPHRAGWTFHGQLSLLQHCLGLGLLEGDWRAFEGAARKLERHHDHGAWGTPDPIHARDPWEASRAR